MREREGNTWWNKRPGSWFKCRCEKECDTQWSKRANSLEWWNMRYFWGIIVISVFVIYIILYGIMECSLTFMKINMVDEIMLKNFISLCMDDFILCSHLYLYIKASVDPTNSFFHSASFLWYKNCLCFPRLIKEIMESLIWRKYVHKSSIITLS